MHSTSKSPRSDSFEKNLERLDAIAQQLEDVSLPLEKALQLYEEGMKLSALCHKQLEEAEGRVQMLLKRGDGKVVTQPFVEGEEESKTQ